MKKQEFESSYNYFIFNYMPNVVYSFYEIFILLEFEVTSLEFVTKDHFQHKKRPQNEVFKIVVSRILFLES